MHDAPILEFDPAYNAVVQPSDWHGPIEDIAPHAVMTWMSDVVDELVAAHAGVERYTFRAESAVQPVWEIDFGGRPLVVARAGVGSPLAAVLLEILIALGCRTIVACGSSGGLVPELALGTVVVPHGALRDEGVSYHYAPADRVARFDTALQGSLRATAEAAGLTTSEGLVWTTDAFFRETPGKVATRVAEGCVAVDMEAAALATVARFRGVPFGHAVFIADTLHGDAWDAGTLVRPDLAFRRRFFDAVAEGCLAGG